MGFRLALPENQAILGIQMNSYFLANTAEDFTGSWLPGSGIQSAAV